MYFISTSTLLASGLWPGMRLPNAGWKACFFHRRLRRPQRGSIFALIFDMDSILIIAGGKSVSFSISRTMKGPQMLYRPLKYIATTLLLLAPNYSSESVENNRVESISWLDFSYCPTARVISSPLRYGNTQTFYWVHLSVGSISSCVSKFFRKPRVVSVFSALLRLSLHRLVSSLFVILEDTRCLMLLRMQKISFRATKWQPFLAFYKDIHYLRGLNILSVLRLQDRQWSLAFLLWLFAARYQIPFDAPLFKLFNMASCRRSCT